MTTKDEVLAQRVTIYPRYIVSHKLHSPNRAARQATRHKKSHSGAKCKPHGWHRKLRQKSKASRRARAKTLGQRSQ